MKDKQVALGSHLLVALQYVVLTDNKNKNLKVTSLSEKVYAIAAVLKNPTIVDIVANDSVIPPKIVAKLIDMGVVIPTLSFFKKIKPRAAKLKSGESKASVSASLTLRKTVYSTDFNSYNNADIEINI